MATRILTAFALLLSLQAHAEDAAFVDAQLLNVESKQGTTNSFVILGPSELKADNYTEVTLQIADTKISARTYEVGGGLIYLANHPEALIVGSTVQARIAKRGVLQIQVPPKGKVLKFDIQRMEKI